MVSVAAGVGGGGVAVERVRRPPKVDVRVEEAAAAGRRRSEAVARRSMVLGFARGLSCEEGGRGGC